MALLIDDPARDVTDHGGSLARAETLFPNAPKPWLDLSTGINPHSYPLPEVPTSAFTRLPEEKQIRELTDAAARAYGAPGSANVVAAPGTQILLPLVTELLPARRAAILSPTYAEHRRAAALAGHEVSEVTDFSALYKADLAILVNPNNPDGHVASRAELLDLAAYLRAKGGLLIVDEAFMDVGPHEQALDADIEAGGVIVLRSFGKFFGLAGLRLGFAIAAHPIAERLRGKLGPWAVSGPALTSGLVALSDLSWQAEMRAQLEREATRLDALLAENGLSVAGGTPLFRFLRTPNAQDLFQTLGKAGILVRAFEDKTHTLRIGLPGGDADFYRLAATLRDWRANRSEALT